MRRDGDMPGRPGMHRKRTFRPLHASMRFCCWISNAQDSSVTFFCNAPDYQPQNSQVPLSRKISAGEEAMWQMTLHDVLRTSYTLRTVVESAKWINAIFSITLLPHKKISEACPTVLSPLANAWLYHAPLVLFHAAINPESGTNLGSLAVILESKGPLGNRHVE